MSNPKVEKVCVIGAGLSGLTAIKELIEKGHEVVCFERSHDIGGVFSDPKTYESVLLTVSNYFMAFSDFMPTDERLRYWTKAEYQAYLERYAEHFELLERVRFGHTVRSLQKSGTGWIVQVEDADGTKSRHEFGAVAICSGQFQKPFVPDFSGREEFQGEILHSTDYTTPEAFAGRRVLCVGLGESSADVTSEIADVARTTTLSLRRKPLVAQRYFAVVDRAAYNVHYPLDVFTSSRSYNYIPRDIHTRVSQGAFKRFVASFDPSTRLRGQWNLESGPESQQVIMKNERVFDAIVDRGVSVNTSGIARLTANGVEFRDGTTQEVDVIMCCTGFGFSVPFFELGIDDPRALYKNMIVPEHGSSLALIGFVRPQQGGVPALAELQSRYFALLCSGERGLANEQELRQASEEDYAKWQSEFCLTPKVRALVNYARFAESLARCIGCEFQVDPRQDPELYQKCFEGPLWAVQYRLHGPGARPERARKIILEKAPVPYATSHIQRFAYQLLLWLRRVLPFAPAAKPRYI